MDFRAHCSLVMSLALFCIFCCCSRAHGDARKEERQQQPPPAEALVTGTVYCDTCFSQPLSRPAHFISGASVAIECGDGARDLLYRKVVTTNRHGVFRARLPPKISKHVRVIEACSVKLIESSEPFCAVASSATTASRLRLNSRSHGVHVYSAGFFTFQPLNQPELCYQKPKPAPLLRDQKAQEQLGFFVPLPTISILPAPASTGGAQMPANPFFPPLLPTNPFFPPQSNALQPSPTDSSTAGGAQLPTNPFPPQSALQPPPPSSSGIGGAQLPPRINLPQPPPLGLPSFPRLQPPSSSGIGGAQLPPRINLPLPPRINLPQPPPLGLPSFPRLQPPSTSINFPPVSSLGAPSPPARAAFLPFPSTRPLFPFPRFPGVPPALPAKMASP